ncbi:MAG: HmuY family protein [Chitinophagales bacterium]
MKQYNKHTITIPRLLQAVVLCVFVLGLSSCFKEKAIAPPNNQGIGQTFVVPMGPDYNDQFFYSLESNSILSQNSRLAYDLLFECKEGSYYVWLNTAKFMSVTKTNETDLNAVTPADTLGANWKYELGEFSADSNAMGKWWLPQGGLPISEGKVYVINLGYDNLQNPLGCIKLKMGDFNGTSYSLSYERLDNDTSVKTCLITKDNTHNYAYFTFSGSGSVVNNIEPDKGSWDFCFTRYSVVFYDPYYLPYEVTGALQNPSRVTAYMDSTVNFDSVDISDFDINRLKTQRDAVGYDWKRYELGVYTPKTWYCYFVKVDDDKFYKLRFLDFNKDGVKGYPTFEFFRL